MKHTLALAGFFFIATHILNPPDTAMNRADQPALEVIRSDARAGILRSLAQNHIVAIPDALSDTVERVIAEMCVAGECDLADDGSEIYPTALGKFKWAEICK
jgi:hypothetical protein